MKNKKSYRTSAGAVFISVLFMGGTLTGNSGLWAKNGEVQDVLSVQQQAIAVSGLVKDENGEPVIGATVVQKGTSNGTITNIDGMYELKLPSNATIEVSYVGYVTQLIPVQGKNLINVNLKVDSKNIDEVVVIGYGSRNKRDVTTAISNVDAETISRSISMSAENAMQGTMSGVQVSGTTGNPMNRPTIRIRGTNSWGIADPLYVIDGIPVTELGAGIESVDNARLNTLRGSINIMTLIDPNDIESISVLKDASSAAIYGVRAANGVVLITTKKGRKDKPTIDFSGRFGVQNIYQELDFFNTQQYTKFVQGVYATDPGKTPNVNNTGLFDPSDPRYLGNSQTYDWQKAVRNKNAPMQDYSVKVSGGTDNTDYYVSLGYSNTEGALEYNYLKRYSGAVKVNTTINKWLRTGINYRLAYAKGRDGVTDYFGMSKAAPWQPIYQENKSMPGYGGYAYVIPGFYYAGRSGKWDQTYLYGAGQVYNQLGILAANNDYHTNLRNMGTAFIEFTPIKGLSIKGSISIDNARIDQFEFTDYDAAAFSSTSGNPWASADPVSVGNLGTRYSNSYNQIEEITVNYANSFGKHNLDFLFNFMDQHFMNRSGNESTNYVTTKKDYLMNMGGVNQYNIVEGFQNRFALMGYMFRIGYNYGHKYYLDATVRRDASARFAPSKRWGTFPSVSAAWRMKSENFLSDVDWLDDLKLRGGWGQLGNQEVRDMAYLSPIASPGPSFAWGDDPGSKYPAAGYFNNGATIYGIPNPDLGWERTETYNVGFDAQAFSGLNFSFEFYNKLTKGILQTMNLPTSVGVINMPPANLARVRNSGFEINLNYNGNVGDFHYSVGGNLTTVRNRVLETYEHIPTTATNDGNLGIEEGHSMFYHKAYKVAGIFQSDEEAQSWLAKYGDDSYTVSKVGAGDFYFQDLRGKPKNEGEFYTEGPDGVIDSYDMVDIGNSLPGFFYGVNLSMEYKGFDLMAQFTGVGDVMKYNSIKAATFFPSEGSNVTDIVNNAWTPQNPSDVYPRLVFGDPAANLRRSDFFYESGAYFRCSNIQLGYTLPQSVYRATNNHIRYVKIYIGFSNLFTITKYTGLDPESDLYPTPRTFFMGLNAKF
ncbi:MAG: TonB-dependent receptor [Bacteroidales bacterium]|nr:TonB-dependent receptor [Bacteroidales bacterium]